MTRPALVLALALPLALLPLASIDARPQRRGQPMIRPSANPSAIISAEMAFNRLAQEKGQWTAFRATASKNAVMFVPEEVDAQSWLKGRSDPAASVKWRPYKALMSCDGMSGVTTGGWAHPDGRVGYFTTVWNWQQKRKADPRDPHDYMGEGEWKWTLDHSDTLAQPRAEPEIIDTKVASCKGKPGAPFSAPTVGATMKFGLSRDQSLSWTWTNMPDNSRILSVRLWNGTGFDEVLLDKVAAPAKP